MKLTQADLDQLRALAVAAGEEVMQVYAAPGAAWNKDDGSPLTEADLRADAVLCEGLARAFPGIPMVSEESGTRGGAAAECFFLIDPLDGTKEFLKRNGEFTVNVALVAQERVVAGVVLAPALGESYFAATGLGAWAVIGGVQSPLRVRPYVDGAPVRIAGSRSHGLDALGACLESLPVAHRFEAIGSSLKFCRVAQGEADAYPRFGPTSQWDTAAAQGVLESAGGCVLGPGGAPLRYAMDLPIVNPSFVALGDPRLFPWFGIGK
jgi:3'(2'),5'-bisphosphate nucleotidase